MLVKIVYIVIFASSALTRHVPRYDELDEEDQLLFRAAYDTPTYHSEAYQEEGELPLDLPLGKLDLLKDGMWALKAKFKEIKIFNKALAANLLATKLQVKELLANHLKTLKKHHNVEIEKKKPAYSYQAPAPQPPVYPQYDQPQYAAPIPQYGAPQYGPPQYEPHQYGPPQYAPPQYGHDPYYGH